MLITMQIANAVRMTVSDASFHGKIQNEFRE